VSAATVSTPARSAPAAGPGYWRGMLWLTWRQHRWPILIGTAVTVGMLTGMAVTASRISHALAMCAGQGTHCPAGVVATAQSQLDRWYPLAAYQLNSVLFLPVLLGLFWGVPLLAREYDQHTLTLAWSQDVSPLKWLWGKLAILGLIAAALGAALAGEGLHLAYLAHLAGRKSLFEGTLFQAGGWMPLTLALAWLAFGVAVGAVVRRTMPALALVFAAFIGRTVLMERLRPDFMTPVTAVRDYFAINSTAALPGPLRPAVPNDMSLAPGGNPPLIDATGHTYPPNQVLEGWCSPTTPGPPSDGFLRTCFHQHGIIGELDKFQPANRMGTFHTIENGTNVGLLILSLLVAWWFVRKAQTTT
jgi:hypothetical protein